MARGRWWRERGFGPFRRARARRSIAGVAPSDRALGFARRLALALLVCSLGGLGVGAALHGVGAGAAGDGAWIAATIVGSLYGLWTVLDSLHYGRIGVDVIALLALLGTMAVGEYLAGAVISVMLASGRSLEDWAAGRSLRDLRALLERAPRTARRYAAGGLEMVDADALRPGDVLLVGPGEIVPVDGILLGAAILDESALSGEPLPVERTMGEGLRSGVVNAGQAFDLRTTTTAAESTYAGIVRVVRQAQSAQAPFVRMADRYAIWFLALSLVASGSAFVVAGATRAVAVLVVATPCPLILAAPVALVAGLSRTARRGVLVKGGAVLERLAHCTTLLCDKTGTLTTGRPTLSGVVTAPAYRPQDLLCLAGSLDQVSPHVLAAAVVQAALERRCALELPEAVEEVAGSGIRGVVAGRRVALGRADWVGLGTVPAWAKAARRRAKLDGALTIFVAIEDEPAGVLVFDDPLRPDAARTIRSLRRNGIDRIVIVTGDRLEVAETIGAVIGVDEVLAERSPTDKLDAVRAEQRRAPTIMVGDGINDAPALALADVGVAMGARGASASSQAADVVLSVDRLDRVGEAHLLARRTRRIAAQSAIAGIAMSLGAMGAAAFGYLPAVWGAILQEGIDVAVILNALRALRGGPSPVRLGAPEAGLARRFRDEHLVLRGVLDRLRSVADMLGTLEPERAMAELREIYATLVEEVAPHEQAEQAELYPALDRLLGGHDPTGPMTRAHVEIAHQIRRLGQLLDDIGPEGPDTEDLTELRHLLYGLHAVLRLHTTQEEESYLSLDEELGAARSN